MIATLHFIIPLIIAVNSASHEYVGVDAAICFDLIEAFIHPMDAVLAVNHIYI